MPTAPSGKPGAFCTAAGGQVTAPKFPTNPGLAATGVSFPNTPAPKSSRPDPMKVQGIPTPSIWPSRTRPGCVEIIDQTALPHHYRTLTLHNLTEAARAIRDMAVRGAPLIGATAAYGLALALAEDPADPGLDQALATLGATRPTAVNLGWALRRMEACVRPLLPPVRAARAWEEATAIAEEDVAQNAAIGRHGLALLEELAKTRAHPVSPDRPLQIMTHCNAGWLATVDHGTALSPIYAAFDAGMAVHVWVSETRPRNQGLLTAWELAQHGVPHTLIADNAAGLLLARGKVDAVIVGADRIARNGDVANKVGTYLKALAAREARVPFMVAAPISTLDFSCPDGQAIPIENRHGDELREVLGTDHQGHFSRLRQSPAHTPVLNPAFDVTPAALVSALITERGSCPASWPGLLSLYPEYQHHG